MICLASPCPQGPPVRSALGSPQTPGQPPRGPHLRVDAFGYRPGDAKVALVREPLVGYDAPSPFTPGDLLEVRREHDRSLAFQGPCVLWRSGVTHGQSGDRCWSFDFSALTELGRFYVLEPGTGEGSEVFEIRPGVYRPVLRAALRMFTHQRCGTPKAAPFIRGRWTDDACHLGPGQDLECRSILDPTNVDLERDLSGGWHDAGDYNKYVNYADEAVHGVLDAFEVAPHLWSDSMGLPESGNGVPDVLDEVAWELEWFLKMQGRTGAVAHKLSVTDWSGTSPPSTDPGPRYYAPDTASATISCCGAFAHAAIVFSALGDPTAQTFGAQLQQAALDAWAWLDANPGLIPSYYNNQGFSSAACEDSSYGQDMNRMRAAAYLFELTGDVVYRDWVDQSHTRAHLFQWGWVSPWEDVAQSGLLRYAIHPGATASVSGAILTAYRDEVSGVDHLGHFQAVDDPYRAYLADGDHSWGSNRTKAQQGEIFIRMNTLGLDPGQAPLYRAAARGYLHYVHGVNPVGLCFLTHMDTQGADCSVRETYHRWFADGTVWDRAGPDIGPPPGFLVGGVNPKFMPDGSYNGPPLVPPLSQPILKSFKDWNTDWPENSWEVTECHIPYQAAYLRLLAGCMR